MALLSYLITETVYHSIADEQMIHELSFFVGCLVVAYYTRGLIRSRVAKSEDQRKLTRLIWLAVCKYDPCIYYIKCSQEQKSER